MLKLSDKISLEDGNGIKIEYAGMKASIIYDNSKSLEEEKEKLLKEKESLEASIARREKLLSNSNYVEKAPKAREALLKEKEMLDIILNKING